MMKRVLIILTGGERHLNDVRDGLISNQVTHVDYIELGRLNERNTTINYDLIVFNCEFLSESLTNHLLNFSIKVPQSQILILAQQISVYAYRQVGLMKTIMALQVPFSGNIFEEVVRFQLDPNQKNNSIRYPRFITDEPARLVVMETGILLPTRMRNYSVGGAFLEYKGIAVRVGQNVQLNLSQQDLVKAKKIWQLNAKVVWTRDGETRTSFARGIGVKFNLELSA